MATFTHTLSLKVTTGSRPVVAEITKPGDGQTSRSVEVAAETDDVLVDLGINVAQIQSIYMVCDQDLKVETNDDEAVGGETLNLLAGEPYFWWDGCLFTNLLTIDITALYLSNVALVAATFELEVVVDSTP